MTRETLETIRECLEMRRDELTRRLARFKKREHVIREYTQAELSRVDAALQELTREYRAL